jgi:catechol 2,3-dioxygenase-like lactoylglutathione lyase family enzyme
MITGLTHVAIQVGDLERSIRFYCDVLGLKEHFRLLDEKGRPFLVYVKIAERQFIELFSGATGARQWPTTASLVHLCLEVDDIQEAFRRITSDEVKPLHGEPQYAADNAWQFWISDPDGNAIEFHQFTGESLQLRPS